MKKYVPLSLVYIRLLFAFVIPFLACYYGQPSRNLIVTLVLTGFIADIFDGIIARRLNISTEHLRLLDSVVDRIFWLLILFSCYILFPTYILTKLWMLVVVLAIEALVYCISLVRFRKIPSPHNLLSKFWGILLAVSFTEILISGQSVIFNFMIVVGIVSRLDGLLIYLLLKKWDHDIPTFYHANQLRKGNEIKRYKLFNG